MQTHTIWTQKRRTTQLGVYHNSAVNLWGCGERRDDALRDLHANFAYLWKEFAEEDDALLDDKAREIKQTLRQLSEPEPARA